MFTLNYANLCHQSYDVDYDFLLKLGFWGHIALRVDRVLKVW